ncbi:MAG: histidine triad nucleotide-binding protein [Dehalococcoidia bacterium]|nr:histidine triad nucleotide-binding protein [Dehalococcoidia bacterium]MQG16451.1 HIT domain-containing protein [SAR202 cluster bacterium]
MNTTKVSCIFCQILFEQSADMFLFKNDYCFAIRDINPVAKVHFLVIPNKHLTYLEEWDESSLNIIGKMVDVARKLADSEGIIDTGYRLSINQREDAGQMVDHLHLHVYGGEKLRRM